MSVTAPIPSDHALDRYLLTHVPVVATLQKTRSERIRENIDAAISRIQMASRDHYNNISVFSTHWASDNTGGDKDSSLFVETTSKLGNEETQVESEVHVLQDDEDVFPLLNQIIGQAKSMPAKTRRLFILHYAGHAVPSKKLDDLLITPYIADEEDSDSVSPDLNMTFIKDALKALASKSEGLDILIVLDCCYSAIAGRGSGPKGERVELMAATSAGGLSNSRVDGDTFTMHWCKAFNKFLEAGKPFTCADIEFDVNSNRDLVQYPASFVLREGWGVPITFGALPTSTTTPTGNTVVTAFHVIEDPTSSSMESLIDFLKGVSKATSIEITILAALPIKSTLLLVLVPEYLQEVLALPRVSLVLDM
jgi:hypothetical protein